MDSMSTKRNELLFINIFISLLWYQGKKVGVKFRQHIECLENLETDYLKTRFPLYTVLYAGRAPFGQLFR